VISASYERTWLTGPDEPRVQQELEYRRRALEHEVRVPRRRGLRVWQPVRGLIDACMRMRRALPWAA